MGVENMGVVPRFFNQTFLKITVGERSKIDMIRLTISAVLLALLIFGAGCSKEHDVVPTFGSTISLGDDLTVVAGTTVTLRAIVQDQNGNPANGVGVVFYSSNVNVASFSPTAALGQTSVESDDSGIATVTIYTFPGSTGTATISSDIKVASDSMDLTVE
jgi:hypothetical protein